MRATTCAHCGAAIASWNTATEVGWCASCVNEESNLLTSLGVSDVWWQGDWKQDEAIWSAQSNVEKLRTVPPKGTNQ